MSRKPEGSASRTGSTSQKKRRFLFELIAHPFQQSHGEASEEQRQKPLGESLPTTHIARRRRKRPAGLPPERRLSCVVRGRLWLLAALFTASVLPCGQLLAEAWPQTITSPRKLPRPSQFRQCERKREQKRRARARGRAAA
jgi:hypothetical protein